MHKTLLCMLLGQGKDKKKKTKGGDCTDQFACCFDDSTADPQTRTVRVRQPGRDASLAAMPCCVVSGRYASCVCRFGMLWYASAVSVCLSRRRSSTALLKRGRETMGANDSQRKPRNSLSERYDVDCCRNVQGAESWAETRGDAWRCRSRREEGSSVAVASRGCGGSTYRNCFGGRDAVLRSGSSRRRGRTRDAGGNGEAEARDLVVTMVVGNKERPIYYYCQGRGQSAKAE
jgi:hypothetical protein